MCLQRAQALAYSGYSMVMTFLPNVAAALVLLYGNLVLEGSMSAGALVSFMLYQQSLSGSLQVCVADHVASAFLAYWLGGLVRQWLQEACSVLPVSWCIIVCTSNQVLCQSRLSLTVWLPY